MAVNNPIPAGCTIQQYRKSYASAEHYKTLKSYSIAGYILVAINVAVVLAGNVTALLDVAILLGLVLGVHIGRIKGCAIGLLVYTIINMIVTLASTGSLGGWMWIIVVVGYLSTFKKIDAEYQAAISAQSGYAPYPGAGYPQGGAQNGGNQSNDFNKFNF